MGEKRPTDHLEPTAKKRGSERQITKDDESDEDQPIEAGTFARASEDVLKQRKIIRARRGPTAGAAPAAGSNPFANVQLAPAAGAPANSFAGVSLVAPAPAAEAPALETTKEEEKAPVEEEKKPKETGAPGAAQEPAFKPAAAATVGGFGAAAAAPSGGLAFGSSGGFGSVKSGTGGFGFLASAPGTSAFGGATTTPAFGAAATTAATTTTTTTTTAAPTAPASVFGSATATGTPAAFGAPSTKPSIPDLPADVPITTGEESESTMFSGTAVLFAFNPVKKEWTNRGSGSLKVNVDESSGQARMVMRQKDTLRLLLNANLWQGLNLTAQEGQSAMSFTCFNHVDGQPASDSAATKTSEKEGSSGAGEGGKAAAPALETYAVKLKKADIPEFIEIVKKHMPKEADGEEAV